MHFEKHIPISSDDCTALQVLSDALLLSHQQIKTAMHNGCVWLETKHGINRIRRAKKNLRRDEILHIYYDSTIMQLRSLPARLVADHEDYSIWDKPYGMYSQGSRWGDHCTIYRWAEEQLKPQRPAFLVHRLDRAANGLILLAHTKTMAMNLSALFSQRLITKHYRLTVEGHIQASHLPLTIDSAIDEKAAITTIFEIEKTHAASTTLLVKIETGRKHQIRRHLASIGHPIIGDRLYGNTDSQPDQLQDLQLQSCLIGFNDPLTNQPRNYTIDAR